MKKMSLIKKGLIFALVLTASAGLFACGKQEESKETTTQQETKDPHKGKAKSFLTGEWIDKAIASKRPVAVMYNNIYEGCPHSGLNKASVIYEAPVEGGICRIMGIFEDMSGIGRIGSLRSARTYFPYFAYEYDAFILHHGQAVYALGALEQVDDLDCMSEYGGILAYRSDDREAPHNSYTNPDMIQAAIAAYGYRTDYEKSQTAQFKFAEDGKTINLKDGVVATHIEPGYPVNYPWFEYNEKDGLYYRWQYGEAQIDENDNAQTSVKNVIFEFCDYEMYEDSPYLNIDIYSSGKGMFFTNGKGIDITWEKESEWGDTHYYDLQGKEIVLNPGKTWVCVCLNEALGEMEIGAIEDFDR